MDRTVDLRRTTFRWRVVSVRVDTRLPVEGPLGTLKTRHGLLFVSGLEKTVLEPGSWRGGGEEGGCH